MCDEDKPETIDNPLLMTGMDFTAWLSVRGVDTVGVPPRSPILRANLLFELASAGKMSTTEIGAFLSEIGLMMPIRET
ncbi:MAG: hypothetical protein WA130_11270 [Candidatus Methanoperedens sp.]